MIKYELYLLAIITLLLVPAAKSIFFNKCGKVLWSYDTSGWVKSISISSNYIVAGSTDGRVYFFNKDGKLLWSYETGGWVWTVSMNDNYIVAGTGHSDHRVYFFNKKGKLLWCYDVGNWNWVKKCCNYG